MTGTPFSMAELMVGTIASASMAEMAMPLTLAASASLNILTCVLWSAGSGPCQSALHFTSTLASFMPLTIESQKGEMPLVMMRNVGAPAMVCPPPEEPAEELEEPFAGVLLPCCELQPGQANAPSSASPPRIAKRFIVNRDSSLGNKV